MKNCFIFYADENYLFTYRWNFCLYFSLYLHIYVLKFLCFLFYIDQKLSHEFDKKLLASKGRILQKSSGTVLIEAYLRKKHKLFIY